GFLLRHLLVGGVDTVGCEPDILAAFARHLWPGAQRPRHQFVVTVEPRGDAVHVADEGSRAAADHAQTNLAGAVLRHFCPLTDRARESCDWPRGPSPKPRNRRTPSRS